MGLQRHHRDHGKVPGLLEVFEFMLASSPAPQGRLQLFVDLGHTGQPGVLLEEILVGGVGLEGRVGGDGRLHVVVEVLHPLLAVEDPSFPAVQRHDGQFVCRARRGEGNRRHGNKRVDDQVCFKARLVAQGAEVGVGPPPGARPAIARLGLVQFVLHAEGFFLNILILGVMPRLQSAFPVGKAGRQALCSRGVQRGPVRHLSNERAIQGTSRGKLLHGDFGRLEHGALGPHGPRHRGTQVVVLPRFRAHFGEICQRLLHSFPKEAGLLGEVRGPAGRDGKRESCDRNQQAGEFAGHVVVSSP